MPWKGGRQELIKSGEMTGLKCGQWWQDLRLASKGGIDPNGTGASMLATDVLWSDPVAEPGLRTNDSRGVGLIFGPEITQVLLLCPISLSCPCT